MELSAIEQPHQTDGRWESRLVYGSYPEIVLMEDNHERQQYLKEIVSSYLYKDILELEGFSRNLRSEITKNSRYYFIFSRLFPRFFIRLVSRANCLVYSGVSIRCPIF